MKTMNKLFLMLLATAALVACDKKETTELSSDVRLVSKIIMTDGEEGDDSKFELQFSYNSENQLNNLKVTMPGYPETEYSHKLSWEYGTDAVIFTEEYLGGTIGFTTKGTYKLDADGAAVSMSKNNVNKEDGVKTEEYTTKAEYTYLNGFLSQSHEKEDGNKDPKESTRTFTSDGNNITNETASYRPDWTKKYEYDGIYDKKCNIDLIQMVKSYDSFSDIPVDFGKRSQGLLVKSTDSDKTNSNVYEYSYKYDSKGYITKIIKKQDSDVFTLDVIYQD